MRQMERNRTVWADTEDVERKVGAIQRALSPTQLQVFLMDDVVDYLQMRSRGIFASEGGVGVRGNWRPLADYTQRDRRRKGFPRAHPINYRTGDLHEYITGSSGIPAPLPDGAMMAFPGRGTSNQQAKFQTAQKGMRPNPRKGMRPIPKRPVIGLARMDGDRITSMLEAHIKMSSNNSGLGVLI